MPPATPPAVARRIALHAALLLLGAVAGALGEERTVPDFIIVCKRNDPQLSECLENSIENLRPRLATGIPEMNVPAMEPLLLREFVLSDSGSLRVTGSDIQCFRTSHFDLSGLKVDQEKGEYSFHLDFPGLDVVGRYKVEGRVLLLPVRGEGPVALNITAPSADVVLRSEMVQRDGEEYVEFSSLEVKIVVPGGSIRLDNLFGGDRVLGEIVNAAVNANFEQVLRELKPSIEKALETNLLQIAQGVARSYPARQLFPVA